MDTLINNRMLEGDSFQILERMTQGSMAYTKRKRERNKKIREESGRRRSCCDMMMGDKR